MDEKIVSVIVPNYNCGQYVGKCLKSIIQQSYRNLQIIVVDDGSTDSSKEVYKDYLKIDNRITVYYQENQGLSAARNSGIALAKGEYITFVDSDDYLEEKAIEKMYHCCEENCAEIAVCSHRVVGGKKNKDHCLPPRVINTKEAIRLLCEDESLKNYAWGKLYKTNLFESIRYPLGVKFEDVNTTWKLVAQSNKIVMSDYIGYNYFIRSQSISRQKSIEVANSRILAFYNRFVDCSLCYPDLSGILISKLLYCYTLLARSVMIANKSEKKENNVKIQQCLSLVKKIDANSLDITQIEKKQLNVIQKNQNDSFIKLIFLDFQRRIKK